MVCSHRHTGALNISVQSFWDNSYWDSPMKTQTAMSIQSLHRLQKMLVCPTKALVGQELLHFLKRNCTSQFCRVIFWKHLLRVKRKSPKPNYMRSAIGPHYIKTFQLCAETRLRRGPQGLYACTLSWRLATEILWYRELQLNWRLQTNCNFVVVCCFKALCY